MKGRSILAAIAGIIAGVVVAYLLYPLIVQLYPIDEALLISMKDNPEDRVAYFRDMPAGFHMAQIFIGIVRLIVGLIVAGLIDRTNLTTLIVVAVFSLLLAVLDVLAYPHPTWYGFVHIPVTIGSAIGFIYPQKKA